MNNSLAEVHPVYLHEKNKKQIVESIKGLKFILKSADSEQ